MVKSTQCVFSTVPELQTEEQYFSAFSQLRWPVHHRCLDTLKTDDLFPPQSPNHKPNMPKRCEQGCTFCFVVHVGNIDASQACNQSSLPHPALSTDEDLVVDCVHS